MRNFIKSCSYYNLSDCDIVETIQKSGKFREFLRETIIEKVLSESKIYIDPAILESLVEDFKKSRGLLTTEQYDQYLSHEGLNQKSLEEILTHPIKLIKYREERWGPRLRSLYLKRKEKYDSITYHCLICENINIMQEVYFRLKDKEQTWGELAKSFPQASNSDSAIIGPVPITSVRPNLLNAMQEAGIGKITKPTETILGYAVAEMIKINHEEIDSELKEKILQDEFNEWIEEETNKCLSQIQFSN